MPETAAETMAAVMRIGGGHAAAVAAVGVAVFLRWLLDPVLGDLVPLVTVYGGVAIGVWLAGWQAGLLAAAVGLLACDYLFIAPRGTFLLSTAQGAALGSGYLLSCGIIIAVGERLRRAQRRARDLNRELVLRLEELQTLLETLPIGVVLAQDPECRRIIGNRASHELMRLPADANLLKSAPAGEAPTHFRVYRHGEELRTDQLPVQRAARGERIVNEEVDLVFDDDTVVHLLMSAAPLRDERARPCGAVASLLDITPRVRAEAAVKAREAELNGVAESTPLILARCTRDLKYRFVNRAAAVLLGAPPQELVGKPMREVLGERAFTAVEPYIERVLRGEAVEFEAQVPYPAAGARWVRASYLPDRNANGEVDGWFASIIDITDRKEAEAVLRVRARQQQAVAQLCRFALRERNLQKVFDYTTAAVAETLEVKYCKVLEQRPEGTLLLRAGVGWREGLVGVATIPGGTDSHAGYALRSGAPVIVIDGRTEKRFSHSPLLPEHGIVSGVNCIIHGTDGMPWGILGVHADRRVEFGQDDVNFLIAVAHLLGEALRREAFEQARELADQRKDEFLATLAHELRNPLAAVGAALSILAERGPKDSARVDQMVGIMRRQFSQIAHLVDDLLDVSRITRGQIRLRRRQVDLAALVQQVIEMFAAQGAQRRHELKFVAPPRSQSPAAALCVHGDPVRLVEAVSNLLSNACRFTPAGGRITVTLARQGGEATISVKDNGRGIAPERLQSIFKMFVRTDAGEERASDQASGLGVGLALARQMVEMHGGSLVAHSEGVGRGAEFVIRLPLMRSPRPASPAALDGGRAATDDGAAALDNGAAAPGDGAAALGDGAAALDDGGSETAPAAALSVARRRILIVEDNLDTACALSTLLELSGHETQTVYEGATAIERAESFRPDVILLDIGLPGMSGYDVCRAIRSRPWGQRMRIVALSGWGKENDRRRAAEAGFDDHLLKPAAPAALATALAKAR